MKIQLLCLAILLILSLYTQNIVIINVSAHNFSTDDNSTFLTLLNMILIENRLINQSLVDNSLATESLLTSNYIKNIDEIIDDIVVSEDSLLIDSDQFYNNTIIATMMANLGDEVLRKYGYAFGIPSNIMINMNFSAVGDLEKTIDKGSGLNNHSGHISTELENFSSSIKDKSQYYGALETSKRMLEIYESDLDSEDKPLPLNHSLSILENSLTQLNKNINNYSTPSKIMEIVHGKVHPGLQQAFNLTLKR